MLLLSGCAPIADQIEPVDHVATAVAATLQAQVLTTETVELDGEIQPQGSFGDCANTGQLSITYVKDGNVWLWVQGGEKTRLTNTGDAVDVAISADGCHVAYSRTIANPLYTPDEDLQLPERIEELWVVASDASSNQLLVGFDFFATLPAPAVGAGYTVHKFIWQPGTHVLAFSTRPAYAGLGYVLSDDIHLVNADTQVLSTLLPMGEGGEFKFSHNGQQVAFSTPTSFNVMNADGSNLRRDLVIFPIIYTYSEYQYYPPVFWTPADDALMVAIPPHDPLGTEGESSTETALWYIPLDGSHIFEAGSVQAAGGIEFSPDVGRIAYLRAVGDPMLNERELVIALGDGSNESTQLIYAGIQFMAWAPDNERFVYSYMDTAFHLVVGNFDNSLVAPLDPVSALTPANVDVDWVTDETIVLLVMGEGGAELSLMDMGGGGEVIDTFAVPFVALDAEN